MVKDKEWLKEEFLKRVDDFVKRNVRLGSSLSAVVYVELYQVFEDLTDQLEEPEINEEQAWNKIKLENHYHIAPADVEVYQEAIVNGVKPSEFRKEKVVIPKFVADWIENRRDDFEDGFGMAVYIDKTAWDDESHTEYDIYKWMKGKERLFIEAVEDGYEVEKEQLYYVMDGNKRAMILKASDGIARSNGPYINSFSGEKKYKFTEKEIKDYDERFWQFAVPVEEVTE